MQLASIEQAAIAKHSRRIGNMHYRQITRWKCRFFDSLQLSVRLRCPFPSIGDMEVEDADSELYPNIVGRMIAAEESNSREFPLVRR
jgi:hypothetical protein